VRARRFRPSPVNALWIVIAVAALALTQLPSITGRPVLSLPEIGQGDRGRETGGVTRYFAMCGGSRGSKCVIDGDTFRFQAETIRIADIDAPETHPPRCAQEARLGERATRRLQELLSAGPFELRQVGGRDADRYGRKLRNVTRGGRSLGQVLVSEGLAREWNGRRRPWCA
jgi:endonuclease YncB( thermonuclease family)